MNPEQRRKFREEQQIAELKREQESRQDLKAALAQGTLDVHGVSSSG